MGQQSRCGLPFGILVFGLLSTAEAALLPRLSGHAVYDTDLDITWAADTRLAQTNTFGLPKSVGLGTHPSDSSGLTGFISIEGTMNWPGALHWIDAMNANNYLGASNWRLPSTLIPDPSCQFPSSATGLQCSGSEVGHLFYDELGGFTPDPTETAKFTTLQPGGFAVTAWSSAELGTLDAWIFPFINGHQTTIFKDTVQSAWVVRSGDIAAVPSPATALLFGSGLVGVIVIRRCRQ